LLSTIAISVFVVAFAKVAFGLGFGWGAVALSIPLSLLAAVAFAPLALLLCGAVIAIKQRTAGTAMVIALLSLVAGFYFPVSMLPRKSPSATGSRSTRWRTTWPACASISSRGD